MTGGLVGELAAAVGPAHLLTDPDLVAGYVTDWTGRWTGEAAAVVRPGSAGEVAAVLAVAARHHASVVCQGGNTGLVGGSVPRAAAAAGGRDQIVLSTVRLDDLCAVEVADGLLEAGAGVRLAAAARHAAGAGLLVGVDLASRESATLGGMVATNAGGLQVLAHGTMREQVAGLEAVLADGTVVSSLRGLRKDNVGIDLVGLLAGSEGTLAVVTRVVLRLLPAPRYRVTALAAFATVDQAVAAATGPLRAVGGIEALELVLDRGMALACQAGSLPAPVGGAEGAVAWLTIEAAAGHDPTEELAGALEGCGTVAIAVGASESDRRALWSYREWQTESVARIGIPHKLDVSVRPSRLAELVARLGPLVAELAPGAELVVFGHVADGNLHVNVVGPPLSELAVDDGVYRLVLALGGSISAEHGIGVAKGHLLSEARGAATLDALKRVRAALDPGRLLNPGVLEPRPA